MKEVNNKNEIGFILDLDGTIVDSTGIISRIQEEIIKKFHIVVTKEREEELRSYAESMFQEDYTMRLAIKIMWSLMKKAGIAFHQRIQAFIMAAKLYPKYLKKIEIYKGARELFQFFDKNSIKYVIVTNSSDRSVKRHLSNYPNFYQNLIQKNKLITKDSVRWIKPHPESFFLAVKRMGVPRNRVVVVGDTKYDILFAKANNVASIGVLTGIYKEDQLKLFEPEFIFNSIADIPENIDKIIEKIYSNIIE